MPESADECSLNRRRRTVALSRRRVTAARVQCKIRRNRMGL